MKKIFKTFVMLAAFLCLFAAGQTEARAGEIKHLNVTVTLVTTDEDSEPETGWHKPVIEVEKGLEITDISWSEHIRNWQTGHSTDCTVTIVSDGTSSFSRDISAGNIRIHTKSDRPESYSGKDCTVKRVFRKDNDTIELTITCYPVMQLAKPDKVGFADNKSLIASWKKVPYAQMYELKLYDDAGSYIKTVRTSSSSYDFSADVSGRGNRFFYRIRSTYNDETERHGIIPSEYAESDDLTIIPVDVSDNATADNSSTDIGWVEKNDKWFYYGADDIAKTAWLCDTNGCWYYMSSSGVMQTGWYETETGCWYYSYVNGVMASDTIIDGYVIGNDGRAMR